MPRRLPDSEVTVRDCWVIVTRLSQDNSPDKYVRFHCSHRGHLLHSTDHSLWRCQRTRGARLFLGHVVRDPEYAILMPIRCLTFVRSPVGRLGRNVAHPIGSPGVVEHFDVGLNETKCMETSANDEQVPGGHHESGDCLRRLARPMSRVRRSPVLQSSWKSYPCSRLSPWHPFGRILLGFRCRFSRTCVWGA